jgi:hypothetical protein
VVLEQEPVRRVGSEGSNAVAEVEFERAAGLQALREQGGGTVLGRVRDDQLVGPAGVGVDRVRAGRAGRVTIENRFGSAFGRKPSWGGGR